jgi:hypothetical protein
MTDDRPPDEADARDPLVAEWLDVPPLDDVTRRRLVRRAFEAEPEPARPPVVGRLGRIAVAVGAAVVAAVVVAGGLTVLLRDGDGDDPTASGGGGGERSAPGEAEREAAAAPTPSPLGDLGDVTDPELLRQRVGEPPAGGEADSQAEAAHTGACSAELDRAGVGAPVATGTGTFGGDPVIVVVAQRDQQRVALVLDRQSCAVRSQVAV